MKKKNFGTIPGCGYGMFCSDRLRQFIRRDRSCCYLMCQRVRQKKSLKKKLRRPRKKRLKECIKAN